MPRKIQVDFKEVERVGALGLNRTESAAALGMTLGSFDSQKYKEGPFKEAWERGLAASKGGNPLPQPAVQLDEPTRKVLDEIREYDGGPLQELPANIDHALNGHTTEIVAALEMARVELLYQRVHREASPKVGDVIDKVETGLETLVKAKAAAA